MRTGRPPPGAPRRGPRDGAPPRAAPRPLAALVLALVAWPIPVPLAQTRLPEARPAIDPGAARLPSPAERPATPTPTARPPTAVPMSETTPAVSAAPPAAEALPPATPPAAIPPADPSPSPPPAPAEPKPTVEPAALDRRAATRAELDALVRDIEVGKERQAEIRRQIDALQRDRARISSQLVATASRIRASEGRVAAGETRIGELELELARARAALDARRDVLADILATLQRIGRKPPPALAVRPEDALAAVRGAILFGAVLPELREEADALLADLQSIETLKTAAAEERDRFRAEATDLAEERRRLELLMEERRLALGDQEKTLEAERARAAALADKAASLRDLVAALGAEPSRPRPGLPDLRLQPAVPFAETRGTLPLPVPGEPVVRFGEDDGSGLLAKGLSIASRAEARVIAPCDGSVIFAGPFRSYGKLLIINGGGGYHVVLAGMDRIDVELGQFVLAGEPVGQMGARGLAPASSDGASGRPVLYVEFRKDSASIDPTPWWARARDEKVRG